MHDTDYKTKPRPSKLFMYEKFYKDIGHIQENNKNFTITEFACGASKILKDIKPSYYQGIDLKDELIKESKKKFVGENYEFFIGNMIDFNTNNKTDLGICIQTLGINLSFDNQILLNCLNNLNDHVLKNGCIIFNLSMDIYIKNKDNIDNFCKNNYQENEFVYYGLFNNRYEYKLTRILVFLEKILFFRSRFKKFVYIKCKLKKN
tara:strand:+ start:521 stop:1135 length:615 start_codon:yes stop_codon:yes gene_type:complete